MHRRALTLLILAIACCLPSLAKAQRADTGLEAVVEELRLLRETIQWQNANALRAQILISRVSLQHQRVARARAELERRESLLQNVDTEKSQYEMVLTQIKRRIESSVDGDELLQLESEEASIRRQLRDLLVRRSAAEERLNQARQAFDAETDRYDELDRWLSDVDRDLAEGE